MDEMRMIAEMLDERPTEAAADMGRRHLRKEIAVPARRRPSWSGPRFKAGLAVVAVGAAAAVAVAAIGSGAPPAGGGVAGGGPRGEVNLGERAVLVAAENAAKQETGEYWFTNQVSGKSHVVRAKTGSYVMVAAHTESFLWAGAEPGSATRTTWRRLPVRPQTPEDAAAWKKAGSPTKIKAWSSGERLTVETPEKVAWDADHSDSSGGGEWYGRMSTEELRKLPADPEKLTEMFLTDEAMQWREAEVESPEEFRELERKRGPFPEHEFDSSSKLIVVGVLISKSPVPPKVRAGLMRAATALPGVEGIGGVVDPLGREGVALASESRTVELTGEFGTPPEARGTYRARQELIFDKETGEVLASQYVLTEPGGPYKDREPGFVIDYMAIRDMGWTDTKREPPAKLPF